MPSAIRHADIDPAIVNWQIRHGRHRLTWKVRSSTAIVQPVAFGIGARRIGHRAGELIGARVVQVIGPRIEVTRNRPDALALSVVL